MNVLTIIPSYNCPIRCPFCYNINKDPSALLDLNKLDSFLEKHKEFSKIVIGGGEPMALDSVYYNDLLNVIFKHYKEVTVNTYPVSLKNFKDDERIHYELSYDFQARPRALEAWHNMLEFPTKFDIKVTISPFVFKYHPNVIFKAFAQFENLENVEFVPYYKNEHSQFRITHDFLNKYVKALLKTRLNFNFNLINRDNIINNTIEHNNEFEITPVNGFQFSIISYDKVDNKRFNKIIDENNIEQFFKEGVYPSYPLEYNMYDDEILEWVKQYGILD